MTLLLLLSALICAAPLHPDEREHIGTPVLLTHPDRFLKAGESYFDPATKRVIFQAIEHPEEGSEPDSDFSIFIGDLVRDGGGAIVGLSKIRQLSNKGSSNTCGWFHPRDQNTVLFATTTTPVANGESPGYQRGSGRYRWAFPPSMNIVSFDLETAKTTKLVTDKSHYVAEGSWSPDGRHLLYCSLATGSGDIYTTDLQTGTPRLIIGAEGYDGGPFFSPDGKCIVYRSDRKENDLLQVFVAELLFDEHGSIIGITREHQLTDNAHVNWAPFWHPSGRFLIYTTSEIGHSNYELFVCDADKGNGTAGYGTGKRRISYMEGFDGLPAFDSTGNWLIWTSKRETGTSQIWVAPFLFEHHADTTATEH
jgi:Tol biopolymer transport system component